ncbi:MAG TPA: SGNH/GDSL hydrolase family protein [Tepidisphaeraceae bacterium]|nr:SGNH/GDSL hydrolase family protein [Tepidisphaeraceae bacterium]
MFLTATTCALAPAAPAGAADAPDAKFRAGDRWCAVGDSITHTGMYTRYVYLFYATRFSDRPIEFFNCGSAGDTAKNGLVRLEKDVLRHKPTVVTIMYGMNDVRRALYAAGADQAGIQTQRDAAVKTHVASMKELSDRLKTAGVRRIFITPSPFDDTVALQSDRSAGVNAALGRCAENARGLAAATDASLIDFHAPMTALNLQRQAADPKFTLIGPDRVHPKEVGGFVMAYLFLKAQGATPYVSDIAEKAGGRSEFSFTCTEPALPFPVPPECADALKLVPFTDELNQQRLRVSGLVPGTYTLSIDGGPVGAFTDAQLDAGVNLATSTDTPQYRQALAVAKLDERRQAVVRILRDLDFMDLGLNPQYGVADDFDYRAALAKRKPPVDAWSKQLREGYLKYKPAQAELRRERDALVAKIREASKPLSHRFSLSLKQG